MFANPRPTGESIPLSAAKLLTPTTPSKMVALVDNYHALVAKLGHAVPAEPLYFLKANNSFLAGGEPIRTPQSYAGKVLFEGELGIVIGKRCRAVEEVDAASHIFGYTCVNDAPPSTSSAKILASHSGRAPRASTRSACSVP